MIEREIENLLESDLRNKGYIIDVNNKNRQVYRQTPKTENEIKLLNGKKPDFIIYDNERTYPIAIIETKKSNYIKLENALNQAIEYAKILNAKIIILYNGSKYIFYWAATKESLFIDNKELDYLPTIEILQKFNTNRLFISNQIQINDKNDLINIFKESNNKLREAGITIGLGRFTEFSNLLFLKLISEKNSFGDIKIPKHLLWESYKDKDGIELLIYINKIIMPELNILFNSTQNIDLFSELKIQDYSKLKYIVNKLDQLNLSSINTDIKGDAFEYFIEKYNSNNNDLGEYFTPRHIVKFLIDIIKPNYREKIYDPFCGTGGILISAFEYILKDIKYKGILNDDTLKVLRKETLFGSEISDTAKIAKMNMILTGDGHSNVKKQDSFLNPIENEYDIVITNIPFNLSANKEQAENYKYKIEKGNAIAIQHIIKSLNNNINARAAIIVPESVLSDTNLKDLRLDLLKSGMLKGIISLPSKTFLPYTEAKTSILILGGKNTPKKENVFFYKVKNDGFTLTTRRRKQSGINDLDEFINIYSYLDNNVENENLFFVSRDELSGDNNVSFLLFKYRDYLKENNVRLGDILNRVRIHNTNMYETASITKQEFWGMPIGNDFWGENFISVTSADTSNYNVVNPKCISFNPARANIGSFGINIGNKPLSVTNAYPVFEIKNKKFLPEYIYLLLRKNNDILEEIANRCYGTVRQSLSPEDFLKIQIPIVPIEIQQSIVKQAYDIYNKFIKYKEKLENINIE
ncbi:MAG: N-6 DNA methylase [Defluviitaleaceae bacterium]|nr:N-6 DNA methylase [Defluviitaleaceae bacterium]